MGQSISSRLSTAATSTVSVELCLSPEGVQLGECSSVSPTKGLSPSTSTTTHTVTAYGTGVPAPYGNTTSAYKFNPDASDNVAVYFGQTATEAGDLTKLCESSNVDIVILAFITDFYSQQGYPTINIGACDPATEDQQEQAPGLLNCTKISPEIQRCQQIGKPVLLSMGGYVATTNFTSGTNAIKVAENMFNLFGGGREDRDISPFGPDVVLDGFDIDNEDHNTTFWNVFATSLRQQFKRDPTKYYLSAAPQCPIPDESISLGAMHQADFVWTQFYNNPSCNLNSTGFTASFEAWSKQLKNGTRPGKPKLYVGSGSFAGAGAGYVPGPELTTYVNKAKHLNTSNFSGMMLWDGVEGMKNVEKGKSYLAYAKQALQ